MPTVQALSPQAPSPAADVQRADGDGRDGFADALTQAAARTGTSDLPIQNSVAGATLGQMLGLPPVPPAEVAAGAPQIDAAHALTGTSGAGARGGGGHPVIAAAEQYLGVPYKWGGTNPNVGLDCSGFTQQAFADIGVDLPRVSKDQSRAGQEVPDLSQAQPGDLLYWEGTGGSANHIGIYTGDGEMMHAPRTGQDVQYDSIRSQPPTTIRRVA
ncbi:NlpC/P60 family protein [Egibacter rhizosphaerae]|uniref:NlpC/P60 family protein n=1 Tax=Egibacter rhizosphaerae TaxID=1670831 RepID=A0A411YET0_9ACTN|nr:C40 family peptidase [Egibacter rhizosphaerae]QBI19718.1 NlpC/P60 family protein [Egibacter rhizosphaerae]